MTTNPRRTLLLLLSVTLIAPLTPKSNAVVSGIRIAGGDQEDRLSRAQLRRDFRIVGDDGRYEFDEVPVLYGLNLFTSVLHGPQGQRREETWRVYVGPGLIEPGRSRVGVPCSTMVAPLTMT